MTSWRSSAHKWNQIWKRRLRQSRRPWEKQRHVNFYSVAYASIHNGIYPSPDFLALPHEIGHHLYWNGRLSKPTSFVASRMMTAT